MLGSLGPACLRCPHHSPNTPSQASSEWADLVAWVQRDRECGEVPLQVPWPFLKRGAPHQQRSWDVVTRVAFVTSDGCPMALVSLGSQQTFLGAPAHHGDVPQHPAGTLGPDPGTALALGVSFLSAAWGTRGPPLSGLKGTVMPGPWGAPRRSKDWLSILLWL